MNMNVRRFYAAVLIAALLSFAAVLAAEAGSGERSGVVVRGGAYYFASGPSAFHKFEPGSGTLENSFHRLPYSWIKEFPSGDVVAASSSEIWLGKDPAALKRFTPKTFAFDARALADGDSRILAAGGSLLIASYGGLTAVSLADLSERSVDTKKLSGGSISAMLDLGGGKALLCDGCRLALYDIGSASVTSTLEIVDDEFPASPAAIHDIWVDSGEITVLADSGIFSADTGLASAKKVALPEKASRSLFGAARPASGVSNDETVGFKRVFRSGGVLYVFSNGLALRFDPGDLSAYADETSKFYSISLSDTGVSSSLSSPPEAFDVSRTASVIVTDGAIVYFDRERQDAYRVSKHAGIIGSLSVSDGRLIYSIGDGLFELVPGSAEKTLRRPSSYAVAAAPGLGKGAKAFSGPGGRYALISYGGRAVTADLENSAFMELTDRTAIAVSYPGVGRVPERPSATGVKRVSTSEVAFIEPSGGALVTVDLASLRVTAREIAGFYPFDFARAGGRIYFAGLATPPAGFSPTLPPGSAAPGPAPVHFTVTGDPGSRSYAYDATAVTAAALGLATNSVVVERHPYFRPEPIVIKPGMSADEVSKLRAENKKSRAEKLASAMSRVGGPDLDGAVMTGFFPGSGGRAIAAFRARGGGLRYAAFDPAGDGGRIAASGTLPEFDRVAASSALAVLEKDGTLPVVLRISADGSLSDATAAASSSLGPSARPYPFDSPSGPRVAFVDRDGSIAVADDAFKPLPGLRASPPAGSVPSAILYADASRVMFVSGGRLVMASFE